MGDVSRDQAPDAPSVHPTALVLPHAPLSRSTHYLLRYPAKFHPPVVKALLERYTLPGQTVLDPFCGSGTLLVEAAISGRHAVGFDVDPVAVQLAAVKTHRFRPGHLRRSAAGLLDVLAPLARPATEYEMRMFEDVSEETYTVDTTHLMEFIPDIPNLFHWFRRYVIIDLARIRRAIACTAMPQTHRSFFSIVFASIIRNASNADPVPVSGLEVTAYMKKREAAGRIVNPFALFTRALSKALDAIESFHGATSEWSTSTHVAEADARYLPKPARATDAVITSPPYHGAVDYYRRHQLEMFWLGLTNSQKERLTLLDRYIGRPRVPRRDPVLASATLRTALAKEWEERLRETSEERADAFLHYMVSVGLVFDRFADILPEGAPAIVIVGHSTWNGAEIPTTALFQEAAGSLFRLDDLLTYSVKNRYMSYDRHNGADISAEYVLVLRRNKTSFTGTPCQ